MQPSPALPTPVARVPEIIAHRGASRDAYENTLAAFALALEQGADGIELDVHATADGVVVVHHDPVVHRRRGGRVEAVAIAALTIADLEECRLPSGDRIPTLAEVFALVGDRAVLYVEVKGRGMAPLVAALLDAHPAVRSAVHAFDHRVPVAVRRMRPTTPIGLLSASYPLDVRRLLEGTGAAAFWQHVDHIDEAMVEAVHAEGARLIAWTVNETPRARELAAWGVDALCTDAPGAIRAALAAAATEVADAAVRASAHPSGPGAKP
jgi:glycerophosphoryl diester phosphodiesterase